MHNRTTINYLRSLLRIYLRMYSTLCINDTIVLFKSIRNSKRRNKGNFTSKSNWNKIKLGGGGRHHYLVLNKISTL